MTGGLKRCLALLVLLAGSVFAARADAPTPEVSAPEATDQLLAMVPPDMGSCIILQDLAAHLDRFFQSDDYRRLAAHPVMVQFKQTPQYRGMVSAPLWAPAYFGISFDELWKRLLGRSLVLAFRPSPRAGERDVGVCLFHSPDPALVGRMFAHFTKEREGRQVRRIEHRGVPFLRRDEAPSRVDFFLQIGPVGVMCDREDIVLAVIDAHRTGKSLAKVAIFQEMRHSLPRDAIGQFLLDPRGFDRAMEGALSPQSEIGRSSREFWRMLRWTALSVRTDTALHIGWHLSADPSRFNEFAKQWATRIEAKGHWFDRVPADCLVAAEVPAYLPAVARGVGAMLPPKQLPEVRQVADTFTNLLAGYDAEKDLLPNIGPHLGLVLYGPTDDAPAQALLAAGLRQPPRVPPGALPLADALEAALRPIMVFYGLEVNQARQDKMKVTTRAIGDRRVHALSGSTLWPRWIEPCFSTGGGEIVVASSPAALAQYLRPPATPLAKSPLIESLRGGFPADYRPVAYVDAAGLRELGQKQRSTLVDLVGGSRNAKANFEKQIEAGLPTLGLFENAVLGTYTDSLARHWVLSISSARPATHATPQAK